MGECSPCPHPQGCSALAVCLQDLVLGPFAVCLTGPKAGLSLSSSLKRTTDVMFGGKQVVVCGYGEVSFMSLPPAILSLSSVSCPLPCSRLIDRGNRIWGAVRRDVSLEPAGRVESKHHIAQFACRSAELQIQLARNAGLNDNYPWVPPSAVPGSSSARSPAVAEPVAQEAKGSCLLLVDDVLAGGRLNHELVNDSALEERRAGSCHLPSICALSVWVFIFPCCRGPGSSCKCSSQQEHAS